MKVKHRLSTACEGTELSLMPDRGICKGAGFPDPVLPWGTVAEHQPMHRDSRAQWDVGTLRCSVGFFTSRGNPVYHSGERRV